MQTSTCVVQEGRQLEAELLAVRGELQEERSARERLENMLSAAEIVSEPHEAAARTNDRPPDLRPVTASVECPATRV